MRAPKNNMKKLRLVMLVCAGLALGAAGAFGARVVWAQDAACTDCVVIYGDSRTNSQEHQKIVDGIMASAPRLVFHLGDAVADGANQQDWDMFDKITAAMRRQAEFYPVYGNHEAGARFPLLNLKVFQDKTWYALQRYGIYFIVLDSNLELDARSVQYEWLQTELKNSSLKKTPVIVMLHRPVFSVGKYYNGDAYLQDALVPLFEKYGVVAVFSAHDHNYQRFLYKGIYYIVSGGGGAPLYCRTGNNRYCQKFAQAYHFCTLSIRKNRLIVDVYADDHRRIDEFKMKLQ